MTSSAKPVGTVLLELVPSEISAAHANHRSFRLRAEALLTEWRQTLMIPPRWTFRLRICCPEELPHAQGSCSWGYLPNRCFTIKLRCDLTDEELRWVVAHELLEAVLAGYGDFTHELVDEKPITARRILHRNHADIRNELVEWLLRIISGSERPNA